MAVIRCTIWPSGMRPIHGCGRGIPQVLLAKQDDEVPNKAATSSAGVIRGVLRNPADLQRFKVRAHVQRARCAGAQRHVQYIHGQVPKFAHPNNAGWCLNTMSPPALQIAVERAVVYDKCSGLSGPAKEACQLDKALVNVASIFAQQVEGRVSTEIDPRTAFDTGARFQVPCRA